MGTSVSKTSDDSMAGAPDTIKATTDSDFDSVEQESATHITCSICMDSKREGEFKNMGCCKQPLCYKCLHDTDLRSKLECPFCREPFSELTQDDRHGAFRKARRKKEAKFLAKTRARVRNGKGTEKEKKAVALLRRAENAQKTAKRKRGLAKQYKNDLKRLGRELLRDKYPGLPQKPSLLGIYVRSDAGMSKWNHLRKVREARKNVAIAGGYDPNQQPSYAL